MRYNCSSQYFVIDICVNILVRHFLLPYTVRQFLAILHPFLPNSIHFKPYTAISSPFKSISEKYKTISKHFHPFEAISSHLQSFLNTFMIFPAIYSHLNHFLGNRQTFLDISSCFKPFPTMFLSFHPSFLILFHKGRRKKTFEATLL